MAKELVMSYTGQIVNRYALEIPQTAVVPFELWMLASLQWSNFSSSCKLSFNQPELLELKSFFEHFLLLVI